MQEYTGWHQAVSNECHAPWQSDEWDVDANKLAVATLLPSLAEALPGRPLAIRDQAAPIHQLNAPPVLLEACGQSDVIDGGHVHADCSITACCQVGLAPQ